MLKAGDLDGAEACYRDALALDDRDADALFSMSCVCIRRNAFEDAARWARLAIGANASFKPAHGQLGNALLALERYEEALDAISKADGTVPDLQLKYQMGLCHLALHRWKEAEDLFRVALAKEPSYFTRFASVPFIMKKPGVADVHYALAVALDKQPEGSDEAALHFGIAETMGFWEGQPQPAFLRVLERAAGGDGTS